MPEISSSGREICSHRQQDPEPGTGSSCSSQGGHRRGNWLQRDPSADDLHQDPGARCRRSAAARPEICSHRQQDPEPGNREQLQRDPLPGAAARAAGIRSRVPGDLQRVPFSAATGAELGHQSSRKGKQTVKQSQAAGTRQIWPESGQRQRDPSADDLHQDPEPGAGDQQPGRPEQLQEITKGGIRVTEKGYKQKIIASCTSIGTYKKEFDLIIDRLAFMYARRDLTKEQYKQSGETLVIEQVNKNGSKYTVRNPYLTELDNCNKIILELEKELGLTPLAKKKIDGGIVEEKEDDPFTAALAQLTLVKS